MPPAGARYVEKFHGVKVYEDDECPPDYVYMDDSAIIAQAWNGMTRKLAAALIERREAVNGFNAQTISSVLQQR
ncbi:hypothetical protein LCGC14_2950870 [marine sediment metagenome]|uniref:Uncharacterized protein n=1 Tax=marine sediment metagenome TaxID=412755 RepID=A0A0F8XF09_9ZZZZ